MGPSSLVLRLDTIQRTNDNIRLAPVTDEQIADDAAAVANMESSLAETGQISPICVWESQDEDGATYYRLVVGHTRYQAALNLLATGRTIRGLAPGEIRADVYPEGVEVPDAKAVQVQENLVRARMRPYDIAFYASQYVAAGHTQAETAAHLGKSEATVSVYMRVMEKGCDALLRAFQQERITQDTAYTLSQYSQEEQEKRLTTLLRGHEKATSDIPTASPAEGDGEKLPTRPSAKVLAKLRSKVEKLLADKAVYTERRDAAIVMCAILEFSEGKSKYAPSGIAEVMSAYLQGAAVDEAAAEGKRAQQEEVEKKAARRRKREAAGGSSAAGDDAE